jgi:hypothetical protein
MTGAQTRNFRTLRSLCGDYALKNVVIVTNMWSRVEPEVGEEREAELMREDIFFKPALDHGARMARHKGTLPSAQGIIRLLIGNRPLPLQIQRELVDENKDVVETMAGQELNKELNDEIRKHQEEIRVLSEEMEQARKEMDEETRNELEIETRRMHEQMRRFKAEAQKLASDHHRERREFQTQLAELDRERREGFCGAGYPQHSSRSWSWRERFSRSQQKTPYDRATPTVDEQSESTWEHLSTGFLSLGSEDGSGVVATAKSFFRKGGNKLSDYPTSATERRS